MLTEAGLGSASGKWAGPQPTNPRGTSPQNPGCVKAPQWPQAGGIRNDRGGFKAKPTVAERNQCVTLEPRKPPEGFRSHAMGRLPAGPFHSFIWRQRMKQSWAVSSHMRRGKVKRRDRETETKRQRSDGVIGPAKP